MRRLEMEFDRRSVCAECYSHSGARLAHRREDHAISVCPREQLHVASERTVLPSVVRVESRGASQWTAPASVLKSVTFKPVAGGWVYRAPNPWVFGDAPHYLVNDAQKAQIEAIIIPRRPVLFGVLLVAGIVAWVFALVGIVWAVSRHDDPTTADVIAIAVLVAISLVAALPLAGWIQRRRLQPILTGLPLTQERITFADIGKMRGRDALQAIAQRLHCFRLCLFRCRRGGLLALRRKAGPGRQLMIWTFNAVSVGILAVVWYRRALRKATELQPMQRNGMPLRPTLAACSRDRSLGGSGFRRRTASSPQTLVATAPDHAKRASNEAAAKAGDTKAMNGLGWLYQTGPAARRDYAKAKEWYAKAAALATARR